jgi:peptidoglycan hydrolase-like protein with peptidoglycan-binding domain
MPDVAITHGHDVCNDFHRGNNRRAGPHEKGVRTPSQARCAGATRGTSLAGVTRCKRKTRIAIEVATRHVAGVAMIGKDVQMRLREIAVALAALSLAGTVAAAGNDTSTSTSGMTNGSSSGQTSSTQAGSSANDQSSPQAGASSSDQTSAPQAGSSQMGTSSSASQGGSASSEQNDPALVRSAQQALKQKGFDAGAADGKIGPTTESALRNFQQAQGLPLSGNLDQQTLAALGVDQSQSSTSSQGSQSQGAMSGQGSQSQGSTSNQGSATQTSGSYK